MVSSETGRGAGLARHSVFFVRAAAVALFLFLLWGCAAGLAGPKGVERPAGKGKIEGVPFHPQLAYQCGPASLAGVLNYYGDGSTPKEIAEAIFRDDIRGTVSLDMVLFARERGFRASFYEGDVRDIVDAVDSRSPLVVMVDSGLGPVSVSHYMVVVGYTEEGVIVNSGRSREKLMEWRVFLYQWERTKSWTLHILPRDPGAAKEMDK